MVNRNMLSKVALPYAEALLESAKINKAVDQIRDDLSSILDLLSASPNLKQFLENPLIAPLAKKNVLNKLFYEQIHKSVFNFLLILVDRRRISLISAIIDKYLDLAYQLESIVIAEVSTAILLTEVQEENLVNQLKRITSSKQVKLVLHQDNNLIAGFTVKIGSKIIDTSVAGQLKQMTFYLNQL